MHRNVLAGAIVAGTALVSVFAFAQSKPAPVASSLGSGRWQIVNPTPDMARNIMLLDTATGNTWVNCVGEGGVRQWCAFEKGDLPTVVSD